MPDGDFVDIDWTSSTDGPIVLLLPGLQGSSRSRYVAGLASAIDRCGWRAAVMHFRGCSGEPNRLARSFHCGETGDVAYIVQHLRKREPRTPLAAVGVSLGGNVLLKWLGETGARAPIVAAVAISVPFVLDRVMDKLETGVSRLYQWDMLRSLRVAFEQKRRLVKLPEGVGDFSGLRRLRDFDNRVTAPLHGFRSAEQYYATSSARSYLRHIRVQTLIIQAEDDPFMPPDVIPQAHELPACVTLETHRHGGHVGFVGGRWPWRPRYFLEERVPDFLEPYLRVRRVRARTLHRAPTLVAG